MTKLLQRLRDYGKLLSGQTLAYLRKNQNASFIRPFGPHSLASRGQNILLTSVDSELTQR